MKPDKNLNRYFRKRVRRLTSLYRKSPAYFSAKDIHAFRVEIKKIKGLFRLVSSSSKKFNRKKKFSPFRKAFRSAGKIRELQLELLSLEKSKVVDAGGRVALSLKSKIIRKKQLFARLKLKKDFFRPNQQVMDHISRINHHDITRFIGSRQKKISTLASLKNRKYKEIHHLRKELKEFFFLVKHLMDLKKNQSRKVENFQEYLGKWHDKRVMSSHLKYMLRSWRLTAQEKKRVAAYIRNIKRKENQLFNRIETGRTKLPRQLKKLLN